MYSLHQHNSTQLYSITALSSIFDATYCLHCVVQIFTLISNICFQEPGKGVDKYNLAQFVMSVRDRIANLNSSKAPIITAAGSSLSADNLHKSHRSAEATSTSSMEAAAAPESSDHPAPKSSIADRIARLKLGEVGKESNESSSAGDAAPKSISSISSKIAMLGANVRLGERPPGAMFSSPSSHQASNIGSRVNTSSSCNSENQADVGSITKSGATGESASLVHVRREIFIEQPLDFFFFCLTKTNIFISLLWRDLEGLEGHHGRGQRLPMQLLELFDHNYYSLPKNNCDRRDG